MSAIRHITAILIVLFCISSSYAQFHNGLQVEYGKNRVQHRDFVWQYHEEDIFEIYYYQGGKELAQTVSGIVKSAKKELTPYFGPTLNGPIQILVYNNHTEFLQSNVGLFSQLDESNNIGGNAKIIGSKLFIYGRGDALELRRDLVEGLARIAMQQTLYRGSWQDALRYSSMLHVPDWFTEGLVGFISDPHSAESRAYIYDATFTGELAKIERYSGEEAGLMGRAVWLYVSDVYGTPAVANILYMVRISSSVESGFRYATGLTLNELLSEAIMYNMQLAPKGYEEQRGKGLLDIPKKKFEYKAASLSPDGQTWAFISDDYGQLVVSTYKVGSEKVKTRAKHGKKLSQLGGKENLEIAWHPDSEQFTYVIYEKGQPFLVTCRLNENKPDKKELFRIDAVLSLDYSPDGRNIVFSGLLNGNSDLYLYRVIGNTQEALWEDKYDDLHPRFTSDGKKIIFSSNRIEGSTLDVITYDLESNKTEVLVETPGIEEHNPIPLPSGDFIYTAEDFRGNQELVWAWKDSTILSIDTIVRYRYFTETRAIEKLKFPALDIECDTTNGVIYSENILNQTLQPHYLSQMPLTEERTESSFSASNSGGVKNNVEFIPPVWSKELLDTQVDIRNYEFEFEKNQVEEIVEEIETKAVGRNLGEKVRLRPKNYRMSFALDKLQSQVSNTFGSQFYRTYDGSMSLQPGLGNASEIRISDLFDDKHIIAGFNIPANLSNSILGIAYYDLSKKLDKMVSLQRQGMTSLDTENFALVESTTTVARCRLTYPFDEVRSIRASIIGRIDKNVPQGTEMITLQLPIIWNQQIGAEVAYVYDDTRDISINIREGLRAKVWSELYFNDEGQTFGTIGFDARHYYRLFANNILAFRAAGNWSYGEQKLLHLLGGVDNAIIGNGNHGTTIDPNINYAYQANITPLRGFTNNARNGTNAMVLNAEFRMPVWSTLFKSPATTDFLRHLQIVGFTDIGAAWVGPHPYSEENTFNTTVVENNPITVTVDNNHEPILYDWGLGLRSRILGYWMSADFAWGVDNGLILDRRFILSLNLDF